MFPIILDFPPITIYSLWVFVALGILIALIFINRLIKQRAVKISFLADHSLLLFFSGLIFSRLFFIIRNYELFFYQFDLSRIPTFFYIWDKGLSPWGAVFGIFLALFYVCRKHQSNFGSWSDIITTSMIFSFVFIHIGSLLDGRNYGLPTTLPWGVTIESSKYAIPIHPTQIYAAIYSLLIALTLNFLFSHEHFKKPGRISLLAIILYSTFRFAEEFLRGDETITIFGIRETFIYTALILLLSSFFLYRSFQTK